MQGTTSHRVYQPAWVVLHGSAVLSVIGLLIVTSVFGLVGIGAAIILHEGSTIVVVLNALRLLTYRD